MNWVVRLHSRKCSLVGSRYIRPKFLAGKEKAQRRQRCQVHVTAAEARQIKQLMCWAERNAA